MSQDEYSSQYAGSSEDRIGNLAPVHVRRIADKLEDETGEAFSELKDRLEVTETPEGINLSVEGYGEFEYDRSEAVDADGDIVVGDTPPEKEGIR